MTPLSPSARADFKNEKLLAAYQSFGKLGQFQSMEKPRFTASHNDSSKELGDVEIIDYQLFTHEGLFEAIRMYQNTIELDPGFAQAYARLADIYNSVATQGWETNATLHETMEIAQRAIALDGNDFKRLAKVGKGTKPKLPD